MISRAKTAVSSRDFWTVMFILAGFLAGGLAGVYVGAVAYQPASIGGITSTQDIPAGAWFRYDLSESRFYELQSVANWTAQGGRPYVIVTCANVTTWSGLKDHTAGSSDRTAYGWSIKVYWQNGKPADELVNGSLDNDNYFYIIKPFIDAWNTRNTVQPIPVYEFLRPQIDTAVLGWRSAAETTYAAIRDARKYGITPGAVEIGVNVNPVGYSNTFAGTFKDIGGAGRHNENHTYGYQIYYDPQSGMLWYFQVTDWVQQHSGWNQWLYMTSYGGMESNVGIPNTRLDAPRISVDETVNESYEYQLTIEGTFDKAYINMTSNDSSIAVTNMLSTSKHVPIDIFEPLKLNVSVYVVLSSLKSNATVLTNVELDRVFTGGQIDPVTLLSVQKVGNSLTATWTRNASAFQYRVLINGSQVGDPVVNNSATIQPTSEGHLNVTVVADSYVYAMSSIPSNGITVDFQFTGEPSNESNVIVGAPQSFATIESQDNLNISIVILLVVIAASVAGILFFFYFKKGPVSLRSITAGKPATPEKKTGIAKYRV